MVRGNTRFISSVELDISQVRVFYVYYIKKRLFKQNKVPIFINLAVGWTTIIFTCEITINNFTCAIISFISVRNPYKHRYTLYSKKEINVQDYALSCISNI